MPFTEAEQKTKVHTIYIELKKKIDFHFWPIVPLKLQNFQSIITFGFGLKISFSLIRHGIANFLQTFDSCFGYCCPKILKFPKRKAVILFLLIFSHLIPHMEF